MLRIALVSFIITSLLLNWFPVQWQSLDNFNIIASICCVLIIVFYRQKWCLAIAASWLTTIVFVYSPIQAQSQLLNAVDKKHRLLNCTVHIVKPQTASLFSSSEFLAKILNCEADSTWNISSSQSNIVTTRIKDSVFDPGLSFNGELIRLFVDQKWSDYIEFNTIYQVVIKVKPVRQKKNFNQFDFEKFAFSNQLIWTANLKQEPIRVSQSSQSLSLDLKEMFRTSLLDIPVDEDNLGLFKAMLMGDKSDLSMELKDIVSRSGLMHLLVISGLHLGLFAGYGVLFAFLITWLFPSLCLYLPRKDIQALFAVGFASLYWLVLPASEPVFRAWLTLVLWTVLHVSRFKISLADKLLISCCGVILIDPMASLSMGFHLTMAALASICILNYFSQKFQLSKFTLVLVFQLGMSILMMPFLLANQMPVSLLSPLINLIAVPVFSLVIMPSVVFLSLFSSIGVSWSITALNSVLSVVNELILATKQLTTATWLIEAKHLYEVSWLIIAAIFVLWTLSGERAQSSVFVWLMQILSRLLARFRLMIKRVVFEPQVRSRAFAKEVIGAAVIGIVAVSAWLTIYSPAVVYSKQQTLTLEFHDVGQGTSVSWNNGQFVSFFDTGPSWSGQSTLSRQIMPNLVFMQGEALFVSHNDHDHAGALQDLLERFNFESIYSGEVLFEGRETQEFGLSSTHNKTLCQQGQIFEHLFWTAEVLYPNQVNMQGNAASCTVYLTINSQPKLRVLLHGDISQKEEVHIIQRLKDLGGVDILMLSHHGSRFSNSAAMIEAASARYIVSTTGFWNHYGHPAKETKARLGNSSKLLDTAKDGAIRFIWREGEWLLKTSREKQYIWQFVES
jgi:competence protein ComEC